MKRYEVTYSQEGRTFSEICEGATIATVLSQLLTEAGSDEQTEKRIVKIELIED